MKVQKWVNTLSCISTSHWYWLLLLNKKTPQKIKFKIQYAFKK